MAFDLWFQIHIFQDSTLLEGKLEILSAAGLLPPAQSLRIEALHQFEAVPLAQLTAVSRHAIKSDESDGWSFKEKGESFLGRLRSVDPWLLEPNRARPIRAERALSAPRTQPQHQGFFIIRQPPLRLKLPAST